MATPTHQPAPGSQGLSVTPNQPAQQAPREVNCVTQCKLGQETVQDIVTKSSDIFNCLKLIQLPNGANIVNPQHQARLQELIRTVHKQFTKLRLLYDECNQLSGGMDQSNAQELIPWKDGQDSLSDLSGLGSEERVQVANQERQDLVQKVSNRNRQLRLLTDRLRALIWDVNTMMAMRHSVWP